MSLTTASIILACISLLSFVIYVFEKEDQGLVSLDYSAKIGFLGTVKRIIIEIFRAIKTDVLTYCPWSLKVAQSQRVSILQAQILQEGEYNGIPEETALKEAVIETIAHESFGPRSKFWREAAMNLLGIKIFKLLFQSIKMLVNAIYGAGRILTNTAKPYSH